MACSERLNSLLRLADRGLPPPAEGEVLRHVRSCEECRHTLELLRAENAGIAAALAPRPIRTGLPLFGRISAAAAALLLLGGALYGLHHLYGQIAARNDRAAAISTPDLAVPVLVRAEEKPLESFLQDLTDEYGVNIELSPSALARMPSIPRVNIALVEPIALRSLLDLLSGFHGLTLEMDAGGVILK